MNLENFTQSEIENLFLGFKDEDTPDRNSFVIPGVTSDEFAQVFDQTRWLFYCGTLEQPTGLYGDFVVGLHEEMEGLVICCKHLHNFPFWAYDALSCYYHLSRSKWIKELSQEILESSGKTWEQWLNEHASRCIKQGLKIDRDYAKARSELLVLSPGITLAEEHNNVLACRDGGIFV